MWRRRFITGLLTLVGAAVLDGGGTRAARAAGSADDAYVAVADWMFDRYLERAIAVTRRNASQTVIGADEAIGKEIPMLMRFLGRHRETFVRELLRPLKEQIPAGEIAALTTKVKEAPSQLDEISLRRLSAVDVDFRRASQRELRAMTFELDLLIEQILGQMHERKN